VAVIAGVARSALYLGQLAAAWWPVAVARGPAAAGCAGWWLLAGDEWRWLVAGGRWPLAGGWWH
jgi:hypothetical protein